MNKCGFCGEKCDGTLILVDKNITMKNGGDVILCSNCLNLYANGDFDKLSKRIKVEVRKMNKCDECGKNINWGLEISFTPAKNSGYEDIGGLYCRECAIDFLNNEIVKERIIEEG